MLVTVVEGEQFHYSVHYSVRRRSVALQIKQGQLTVKAPVGVSLHDIKDVVNTKQRWILKHLALAPQHIKPDWLAQRRLPFLGEQLVLQLQSGAKSTALLQDNVLQISLSSRCKLEDQQQKTRTLIQQWYKAQAQHWFCQRVQHWQRQMNLHSGDVVIGNWKTKWGFCKHNAELGFNWRLLMAPEWVADYVVVHELAHLKHLNHSAHFWQLVQHYYPNAKLAADYLKQNQYWMEV